MSLRPPVLDDRTFQNLVDEAKTFIRSRCPEWTDHNVSDPGVTLIEAFAWMVDTLIYRVNRVPDRQYVKFLELIGVTLNPPSAATTLVSFRLSAHLDDTVVIERGTVVSTRGAVGEAPVCFHTIAAGEVVPAVSTVVLAVPGEGEVRDLTSLLGSGVSVECFSSTPVAGDALYVSLDRPMPGNIVLIQCHCDEAEGHGIDPLDPPLQWQAWNGNGWVECDVELDETRGLNASGPVEVHVPQQHDAAYVAQRHGNWLRCIVVAPKNVRPYRSSPKIYSVSAATIGVDIIARHAQEVRDEPLGVSSGLPGQVFELQHTPVLTDAGSMALAVGGVAWEPVETFADSQPNARHFSVDATAGTVHLGPAVRWAGRVAQHGAVPPKGVTLEMLGYLSGGGADGNVAARGLSVLRSSIPYVARVYNRRAAAGGVDGETMDEVRVRGPLMLHARNRAVTLDDYVTLTRQAAPEIGRVRVTLDHDGTIQLLIAPRASDVDGRMDLLDLLPTEDTLDRIRRHLDERRTVGATVAVAPTTYRAVTVTAVVSARAGSDAGRVERETLRSIYRYLNPFAGGPNGDGWPYGRAVSSAELAAAVERVPGIAAVDGLHLYVVSPLKDERTGPHATVELRPTDLVFATNCEVSVR